MARVTVEDCVDKVSNRFDLVLYAGYQRASFRAVPTRWSTVIATNTPSWPCAKSRPSP